MSGTFRNLCFFSVDVPGSNVQPVKVAATDVEDAAERACTILVPDIDLASIEYLQVTRLTWKDGKAYTQSKGQGPAIVSGPGWNKGFAKGDDYVHSSIGAGLAREEADTAAQRVPTLAELAQEEQGRRQLDEDFANASYNSQAQEFDATVAMQADMTELDGLNDEEACRMMNEEDACRSMAAASE